jgi:hypothetical protein
VTAHSTLIEEFNIFSRGRSLPFRFYGALIGAQLTNEEALSSMARILSLRAVTVDKVYREEYKAARLHSINTVNNTLHKYF